MFRKKRLVLKIAYRLNKYIHNFTITVLFSLKNIFTADSKNKSGYIVKKNYA